MSTAWGSGPLVMGHMAITLCFSRSITTIWLVSPITTNILGDSGSSTIPAGFSPSTSMLPASLPFLTRSEEHTSELQSRLHLVCRLLLEKKKQLSTHLLPMH